MPDGGTPRPSTTPTCAFVQFQELYRHAAHTVGHLTTCDAFATLGVPSTLYMMPPSARPKPTPDQLKAEFALQNTPRLAWMPRSKSVWIERARTLVESARAGAHATFSYSTRALPTLGALIGGVPQAVLEVHVPPSHWALNERLAFALARRSSRLRLVCISSRLADVVAHETGIARASILAEHSAHNFEIHDDYRIAEPADRTLIMYVGSFQPGKGVDLVFDIARRLPAIDFVVVGGEAPEAGLPDNVEVRPRVPLADVPALLGQADVLLMPFARYDGSVPESLGGEPEIYYSPRKMGEYLAVGRPIVASNLPSITEVMVDGENCLIAEPQDVEAWADAVSRLAHDPALRQRLAHNATVTAHELTTLARAERLLSELEVAQ